MTALCLQKKFKDLLESTHIRRYTGNRNHSTRRCVLRLFSFYKSRDLEQSAESKVGSSLPPNTLIQAPGYSKIIKSQTGSLPVSMGNFATPAAILISLFLLSICEQTYERVRAGNSTIFQRKKQILKSQI